MAPNRRELLDALASSESTYVKRLKAICNAYLRPLSESRALSNGEVNAIFRGLSDLREVHTRLSGVIQAASDDDDVGAGVAAVAAELGLAKAALLELYIPYARGAEGATRALRAAAGRAEAGRALDGIASGDERVRGESLERLLDAPLERCHEYATALSALLSASSPGDRGYAALADAADLAASLAR